MGGQKCFEQSRRGHEKQLQRPLRRDPSSLGRWSQRQQILGQDRQVGEGQGQGIGPEDRLKVSFPTLELEFFDRFHEIPFNILLMIHQRFRHPGFHSPPFSVYKNTNSVVEKFFDRIRLSTAQIIKNSFPSLELL